MLHEPGVKGGGLWTRADGEQAVLVPDEKAGLFSLRRELTRAARSWRG